MNISDLHDYQIFGYNHIINTPYCGLFLDMGLGKTVTALTAINALIYSELEINNVLIVAPKRVAETVWSDECEKWDHLKHLKVSKVIGSEAKRIEALNKKADIYVISRDNVAWLCSYYGGTSIPFDMLVIDELSSFKSYKSIRFKALKMVRPSLKRVVGLTGTPAPNGYIDLWAQMYLIDRGERLEKTITRYRERYFREGQKNGAVVYNYCLLENSEAQINKRISDICISMKASDYLNMPERMDNYIYIDMPENVAKAYKDFEKNKVLELIDIMRLQEATLDFSEPADKAKVKEISVLNAAALSNKLLQFANGAIYDENREVHEVHNLKIDALKELIEDANGKPVLVAWAFQHDRDRLLKALRSYKPRQLLSEKDIRDWNAGKVQVMLAHPASAGHGLNLQAGGNIIIWFGLTWSLELYQQFNGRLFRQGQQSETVIIHHLALKNTHDMDVIKAIQTKDKKQENLLNSIKAKINKYKISML